MRKMVKEFGALLIIMGFFLTPLDLTAVEEPPQQIIFKADLGSVTFLHDKHKELTNHDCSHCHHVTEAKREKPEDQGKENQRGKNDEKEKKEACRTCHKRKIDMKEGDPPSFFEVKMKLCRGCHQQKKEADQNAKAPVHCNGCHNVKEIRWSD